MKEIKLKCVPNPILPFWFIPALWSLGGIFIISFLILGFYLAKNLKEGKIDKKRIVVIISIIIVSGIAFWLLFFNKQFFIYYPPTKNWGGPIPDCI